MERLAWMSFAATLCAMVGLGGCAVAAYVVLEQQDREQREQRRRWKKQARKERRRAVRATEDRLLAEESSGSRSGRSGGGLRRISSAAARRTVQVVISDVLDALGSDHRAWAATFERMDRDGNGDLTAREFEEGLRRLTGARLSQEDVDELMYEIDRDGDGRIDYVEFIDALRATRNAHELAREVTDELGRKVYASRHSCCLVL